LPYIIHTDEDGQGRFLDPCCGDGAILDVVKSEYGLATRGVELNEERARIAQSKGHNIPHRTEERGHDALKLEWWPDCEYILTNQPYSLAQEFIEKSFEQMSLRQWPITAGFLLRLNFLGAQCRAQFHIQHPPDVFVLSRRPEFVMSVKCSQRKKYGCEYEEILPITAPRPEGCPICGFPVTISTTDATEYAWFLYSNRNDRGGRLTILDVGDE
jgi:hypothetical protein